MIVYFDPVPKGQVPLGGNSPICNLASKSKHPRSVRKNTTLANLRNLKWLVRTSQSSVEPSHPG